MTIKGYHRKKVRIKNGRMTKERMKDGRVMNGRVTDPSLQKTHWWAWNMRKARLAKNTVCHKSSDRSNRIRRNASMNSGKHPAHLYGRTVFMTISSVVRT